MATPASIVLLGLVLGMRHATDPDHVIAVTTIVARQRRAGAAALIGLLWGIGHTLTIVAVGGAIIVFGVVIPPRLGLGMELSVALMLIVLGLLNMAGILRWITPAVTSVDVTRLDRRLGGLGLYQVLRPLAVGVVHGLAGSAAVALLVLATISDPLWGIAYLLVFGAGTIAGMMLVTAASALPFTYTARRFATLNRHLMLASGAASVAFGLFLVYQIGVVDGLFTGGARWAPQ